MHLKQNNFYTDIYNVECYISLDTYVLNPLYNVINKSTWIYRQVSDYSYKYPIVEIGYVLSAE